MSIEVYDGYRNPDFISWGIRRGYQHFIQPNTVDLSGTPATINEFGWINLPTTEFVIPFYKPLPDAQETIYWYYEKLTCNSSNDVRMSLEGNTNWREDLQDYDPDTWFTQAGYVVSSTKSHQVYGMLVKTVPGEAIRLRIHSPQGNNSGDMFFKWLAIKVPWIE